MTLGHTLADMRADLDLSQPNLAERVEALGGPVLTQWRISRIEGGSTPRPGELEAILRALEVPTKDWPAIMQLPLRRAS
mgnify:CR=1 FL=1